MLARGVILTLALVVLTVGCAVNRYVVTPYDHLTFTASRDVNPDTNGRPSPVAVKVYQLTSRTTFDNLDFDAAFDNASVVLSDELLSGAELVLQPGERREVELELESSARFVAIIAAYRDIDNARWKQVLPVNGDWYYSHDIALTAWAVSEGNARKQATRPEEADPTRPGSIDRVDVSRAPDDIPKLSTAEEP